MAFLKLSLVALAAVAHADFDSDVDNAIHVLQDLPSDLATDFCRDYTGIGTGGYGYGGDAASTVTATLTSTVPCGETPYPPGISTVSSTTTVTTTTLTTYVPYSTPAAKKQRRFQSPSSAFCVEYGIPCRMVQYDEPTILAACGEFLGSGPVTTVTTNVTSPATTCAPTGGYYPSNPYETPTPDPYPGSDEPVYEDDNEGGEKLYQNWMDNQEEYSS